MRHCGPGLVYIQSRPLVLCVHSPSASFPCDEVERRYFELFREQLAFNFCGYFETLFWTQLVPQECHHEPAIRYAIFALAALCKSSTCNVDTAIVTDEHLNFAFVQYGKAVCSLRQSLAEDSSRVRLALIASVLFGCFESFYGKWQTAAQHVYSGLNILKRLQRTSNDKTCKWQTAAQSLATVEPVISQALGHLNLKLLIISFLAMSPLYDYPFDDSEDQAVEDQAMIQQLPGRFTTLGDAFPSAISLSMSSLLHLRRSGKYTNGEPLQLATAREQESLSTAVDRWLKAFRPILTEASQNLTSRKHLGALQLQICLLTSKISMSTSIYRDEMMFDKFTRQFQYIVSISRHVLEKDQEFRASSGPKTQFSMGLIMSLYYTATRCRDSSVRRDAIAILKELPRRNGVWDSWQAAKAAEWIVSIEEEGCDSNGFIPEEWRVRMTSLNVEMRNGGRVSVECMQGSVDHMLKLRKADLL